MIDRDQPPDAASPQSLNTPIRELFMGKSELRIARLGLTLTRRLPPSALLGHTPEALASHAFVDWHVSKARL
jgi:hypothetical protein